MGTGTEHPPGPCSALLPFLFSSPGPLHRPQASSHQTQAGAEGERAGPGVAQEAAQGRGAAARRGADEAAQTGTGRGARAAARGRPRPRPLLTSLPPQELSLLPLTEPTITANFSLFAPFGSSPINGKSQLRGAFGSAVLDSVPDYYSQLLTKVRGGAVAVPPAPIWGSRGTAACSHPAVVPPTLRTTSATHPRRPPRCPPRRPPPCSRRW